LASLVEAIISSIIPSGDQLSYAFGKDDDEIKQGLHQRLNRLLSMDRWMPSFQQTISQASLQSRERLSINGIATLKFSDLLLYVREGVSDLLRALAYDILLNLGALRHAPLVKLIFYTLRSDPSPFIRRRLVRAIGMGLGSMALKGTASRAHAFQRKNDEMVIEEDAAQSVADRKDLLERASIEGAIQALRNELVEDEVLKTEMWKCVKYVLSIVI
jgi:transcription initiation factor TFIID subunit 2